MFAAFSARRKTLARLAAVLALTAVTACAPVAMSGGDGVRIDPSQPVQVALLVPGGSTNPGDNLVARSLENAARLAVADLQDVPVDLRVYNTGGSQDRTSAVAAQAVQEGAKIILGPLYAGSAAAAGVAAAPAGVSVLAFSNNPSVAGGNVFVLGPTFDNTAQRLVRYARGQGLRDIAIIHGDSPAEALGRDAIAAAARDAGARVATIASFPLSQQGLAAAAPSIANNVRASGAQAVFLTSDNGGALPVLAEMLPQAGLGPQQVQYVGISRLDIPAEALALPGLQGALFARPDESLYRNFANRYNAAYGAAPHPLAGLAYDGIAAIGALVKTGEKTALTPRGLTRKAGFVGVNGIFRLRPDGTNERALAVAQIRNNQVVELDPAPRSFGGGFGF